MHSLTREIEVFENQRYVFTKFSKEGLLPTDRRAYSTSDGSISWKELEDAEDALLSLGWDWNAEGSPWSPDKEHPNTDEEGWSYDVDFGTFQNSCSKKGMTHFVRRRRLTRIQDFDINRLKCRSEKAKIEDSCDTCDLTQIEHISNALLQKLAITSLKIEPKKAIVAPTVNPIKTQLIETLLGSESMGVSSLLLAIEKFEIANKSIFKQMFSTAIDKSNEEIPRRANNIVDNMLFDERSFIAKALIKKHDVDFKFHCNIKNCGEACEFAPEACLNPGCSSVHSRKYHLDHDAICPHKIVPCERNCGDTFPRRMTETHMSSSCPLRPVACPFADLGCSVSLLHKDVPEHLDSCSNSHLLLAVDVVRGQRNLIEEMSLKLQTLEQSQQDLNGTCHKLQMGAAAALVAIETSERKIYHRLHDDITKVEKKSQDANSKITNDLSSLSRAHGKTSNQIAALEKQIAPIIVASKR